MCCCCDSRTNLKEKFGAILGKLKTLRKICRAIALLDATFGLMFLILIISRRALTAQQQHSWTGPNIVRVCLLSFLGLQIFFALLLYEGARRGILCLIKAWLIFSLIRMLFQVGTVSIIFLRTKGTVEHWPTFCFEISLAVFQVVEALIILAFHKKAKNTQNTETEQTDDLPDRDNYWLEMNDLKDIRCSYLPSAPPQDDVVVIENVSIPNSVEQRGVHV